jgi:N-alpha-acetyltransferase 40
MIATLPKRIQTKNCNGKDCNFLHDLAKQNMEKFVVKFWGKWDEKRFRSSLKKGSIKIIKFNDDNIGYYHIEIENDILYIHNLQIAFSFQRKGIGRYVMQIIEEHARKNKIRRIDLKVFSENSASLFYEKLGYKQAEKTKSFTMMTKNI